MAIFVLTTTTMTTTTQPITLPLAHARGVIKCTMRTMQLLGIWSNRDKVVRMILSKFLNHYYSLHEDRCRIRAEHKSLTALQGMHVALGLSIPSSVSIFLLMIVHNSRG